MAGSKSNKLTLKQKKFAAMYVAGPDPGNATEAAMQSYNLSKRRYANDYANNKLLKNPLVLAEIDRVMEKVGLSDDLIIKRIREGLDAKMVTAYRGRAFETEFPDHKARHRYIDTAAKIKNLYPGQKKESRNLNLDITVEKMPPEELAKLLKGMAKQINVKSKTKARILKNHPTEHREKGL